MEHDDRDAPRRRWAILRRVMAVLDAGEKVLAFAALGVLVVLFVLWKLLDLVL